MDTRGEDFSQSLPRHTASRTTTVATGVTACTIAAAPVVAAHALLTALTSRLPTVPAATHAAALAAAPLASPSSNAQPAHRTATEDAACILCW